MLGVGGDELKVEDEDLEIGDAEFEVVAGDTRWWM